MNREILFRGKRADNGKWVYGYYINHYIYDFSLILCIDSGEIIRVAPKTVGQYIGETDINKSKIYEGDILSWKWNKMKREYLIIEDIYTIWRKMLNEEYWELPSIVEVIGNIHDNPELVKQIKNK